MMAVGVLGTFPVLIVAYFLFTSPTNKGPWKPMVERVAIVTLGDSEEIILIQDLRRARYGPDTKPTEILWQERRVNLADLKDVWFGISVFDTRGFAHTFLSFDFGDGDPVVVSVEARQRPGQRYGIVKGLLDRFHLIYVMADERDVLGLRTHLRGEEVYFHPLTITQERARDLFLDLIERVNTLATWPEFYNTFTSNCTNALLRDAKFPVWRRYLDKDILLPAYSDKVAYEFGILDRTFPLEDLRAAARVDPNVVTLDDPDFSEKIRAAYWHRLGNR